MTDNIEVFTQSSIRIKDRNRTIYVDQYRMKEEPKDADYILITHDHYDHFSPEDIAKVACDKTVLIVPERMVETAEQVSDQVEKIVTVKPGVYCETAGLERETIPF
jgi:L-ascorbate metabolism protein UlaG (beta-lactamase superfamily)